MNVPIIYRAPLRAAAPPRAAARARMRAFDAGARVGVPARIEAARRSGLTAFDR